MDRSFFCLGAAWQTEHTGAPGLCGMAGTMAKKRREILTGIEIGTSTVKVVMGEFLPDDVLAIVGVGEAPSLRVSKGEIEEADVVGEQLKRAVRAAETASGMEIDGEIFLAVSGGHVKIVNSIGNTLVQSSDRRICEEDVINAAQAARGYTLPPDKQVLHSCERGYKIDENREVTNAIGIVGSKLEADVQIVYGQHNRLETNCRLLADVMGYAATDIAFSGVASAFAAFDDTDRSKGGLLIDIGAGVTEYVVFSGNGCYHCGQVTIGCDQIANDLSVGLQVPIVTGRAILRDMGEVACSAIMNPDGRARIMTVEGISKKPRQIPRSSIEHIVELRLRELFEVIRADLTKHHALERVGGLVKLCGGGALIPDLDRLANDVFRRPAVVARPLLLSGKEDILNSPLYFTPVGLIRWGKLILEIEEEGDVDDSLGRSLLRDARSMVRLVRDALRW